MLRHLKMYYVLVALPYVLLLAGSAYFFEPIKRTILNNPIPHLNYAIIIIVLTGGIFILINARRLVSEASKLREFSRAVHAKTDSTTLREKANSYTGDLACILQMVAASGDRSISHQEQAALEHELTNARSRLVRRNALPQYLTGLLVAMGLLGTFIGLLATLADISVLIGSFADLDMKNIEPIQVFRVMIERMKAPMSSMGIAFSTSMFGLLGSIVIGLMMLGIRRLQGDIISMLSSEVARHIENALSFESLSFRGGEAALGCYEAPTDLTSKVLLRIEERLAESARLRQRALSAEIDDFKKQRGEMLQVLSDQTEASNNFRSELQQLGSRLGDIFTSMEKRNSEISSQISDLTVRLGGDAKETHKLLAAQVDEQQKLRESLDSYNIEEWLAETARMQQRTLSAEMEDFKNQREEMLRTLAEQAEASRNFRGELQQLGGRLGDIFEGMEKGNGEISHQISELTVHMGADAKESHRLLNVTGNNLRSEMQNLGKQVGERIDALSEVAEKGNDETGSRLSSLLEHMEAESQAAQQQLSSLSEDVRSDLQQLGDQLGTIASATDKGHGETAGRLADMMTQMAAESKQAQQQLSEVGENFRSQLQQLG
nr:hypothetical protein [Desulfuromonadales bacterium]NIR34068.1 hypothetical protein [Desulfuromonadales bacterium]NIS40167.1 hypothetical protein [Desulfuromonadales bacterium]